MRRPVIITLPDGTRIEAPTIEDAKKILGPRLNPPQPELPPQEWRPHRTLPAPWWGVLPPHGCEPQFLGLVTEDTYS